MFCSDCFWVMSVCYSETSCFLFARNRNLQTLCPARQTAGDHRAKWLNCEVQVSRQQSGSRVKDEPGADAVPENPQTARLDLLQRRDQDHLSQVWVRVKTTESRVIGRMLQTKYHMAACLLLCFWIEEFVPILKTHMLILDLTLKTSCKIFMLPEHILHVVAFYFFPVQTRVPYGITGVSDKKHFNPAHFPQIALSVRYGVCLHCVHVQ